MYWKSDIDLTWFDFVETLTGPAEVENIFMTLEQFTKIIDHCTVHRHNRFARFDFKSKQTFRVRIPNILNSEKYQVLFSSLQEDSEDFKSSVAN